MTEPDLRTAALQHIAITCKTDLFYLAKEILNYDKMTENTHKELCNYTTVVYDPTHETTCPMDENFDPRKNLLLLLMPRGTFKSSVVTIGLTLQFILNEPNCRILIDSETFSKSKAFLREILGHLENNPKYREVFRAIHGMYPFETRGKARLWTDSEVILPCRTRDRKEPTISCAGVDVTKNGMHYDLIIADDLHSQTNVTTKEQIENVIEHYKLTFSLLDPGKPYVIIGTRWDYSDLYQHILDFEHDDFNILKRSSYNDDGSLFFPEVLIEKELDKIRRRQGTSIFSKQYLNEPVSDENATFKRDFIKRVPLDQINGRPMNWYLVVDPSYTDPRSSGGYSDYAAMVLVGMDYMHELYVRYIVREKMTYAQIIDKMFSIYQDQKFKDIRNLKIVLEVIGTKSLSYELANEQKRRNTWLPVTEIKSRAESKEERIRGLAPFYEYGHVYHIQECPNIEEMEYELLHFPTGRHDDMIDCLATVLEVASSPNNNKKEYDSEGHVKHRSVYKPRSPITGV